MNKRTVLVLCFVLMVLTGASLLLWTDFGFSRNAELVDESKGGDRERRITQYLASVYEQPLADTWQEGRVYFLPQKSKVDALGEIVWETDKNRLEVYKSSIWVLHWGPEEFPVLVLDVKVNGGSRLVILDHTEEIVEKFPSALEGLKFNTDEERHGLAMLLVEMVHAFYSRNQGKALKVSSEGSCEMFELTTSDGWTHTVGPCFTREDSLETVILRQARKVRHEGG